MRQYGGKRDYMIGRCGRGKGETFRQDSTEKGLKVGCEEGKDEKGKRREAHGERAEKCG